LITERRKNLVAQATAIEDARAERKIQRESERRTSMLNRINDAADTVRRVSGTSEAYMFREETYKKFKIK